MSLNVHFLTKKSFFFAIFLLLLTISVYFTCPTTAHGAVASESASQIQFTEEELNIITNSAICPIKVGIIPDQFPLSEYSKKNHEYKGIIIDLLSLVAKKSGLSIEFIAMPVDQAPVEFLHSNPDVSLVAGTIKSKSLLEDDNIIFSDKLFDTSVIFVCQKKDLLSNTDKPAKIAVQTGFKAGEVYLARNYPHLEVINCKTSKDCLKAVSSGQAKYSLINRYVASYFMQQASFDNLAIMDKHGINWENCVTAQLGSEALISVINKGLNEVTDLEYSIILLNLTTNNPSSITAKDYIYKFKYTIILIILFIMVSLGTVMGIVAIRRRKVMLYIDPLTGLFSRFGFEVAIQRQKIRNWGEYFIVYFSIIQFESFIAVYGNEVAENIFNTIADKLRFYMRREEFAGRVYMEHFVLMLNENNLSEVKRLISDFNEDLLSTLPATNIVIHYGIYPSTFGELSPAVMIDRALTARKSLPYQSDSIYAVYDENMHKKILDEAKILSSFSAALEGHEFFIMIQPKFDTNSREILGGEALIRWRRKDGTLVMPGDFIALFEKNDRIVQLDFYMMELVCILQSRIKNLGLKPLRIAANFSKFHLYKPDFVSNLLLLLKKYSLSADLFEIELTESAFVDDTAYAIPVIQKLKENGFSVAMDDFGSGYSSLGSLKELAIDVLKIDKKFIQYEDKEDKGQYIIKSILALAKELSLTTVAEGVETENQLLFLKNCNACDQVQGYLLSKPVNEDVYIDMLKACEKGYMA